MDKDEATTENTYFVDLAVEAYKSVKRAERALENKKVALQKQMSRLSRTQLNEYVRVTDELDKQD